jgi:hypothetical protein
MGSSSYCIMCPYYEYMLNWVGSILYKSLCKELLTTEGRVHVQATPSHVIHRITIQQPNTCYRHMGA